MQGTYRHRNTINRCWGGSRSVSAVKLAVGTGRGGPRCVSAVKGESPCVSAVKGTEAPSGVLVLERVLLQVLDRIGVPIMDFRPVPLVLRKDELVESTAIRREPKRCSACIPPLDLLIIPTSSNEDVPLRDVASDPLHPPPFLVVRVDLAVLKRICCD